MEKRILITGGTGIIGSAIADKLTLKGNDISIFSRKPDKIGNRSKYSLKYIKWNYKNIDEWKNHIDEKEIIIHLAGANLAAKRWNDKYKEEIYNSRIVSTRNIVNVIRECNTKPEVFITVSAVGIYGNRGNELLTEESKPGNDFLSNLCCHWEREAAKIEELGVRRVSLRIGLVLSKNGGVLKRFLLPFRLFIGGPLGNGKQWFPWIHINDLASIFIHAINNKSVRGPVNCVAPGIVTMKDFAKTLGSVLNRPSFLPVPRVALKIIIGEITESVLSSQKVSIKKLLNSGFTFQFRTLEDALQDLLKK